MHTYVFIKNVVRIKLYVEEKIFHHIRNVFFKEEKKLNSEILSGY